MDHLDEISLDELRDALARVDGSKPTQRLLAAIAYKNGVSQTELAEWHGVERRTIYNWLTRLDTDESISRAVTDANRSGRNRKLSKRAQEKFERTVAEPPTSVGIDASTWTPALVQQHLREAYDVDYSRSSCRRLLTETGLRYRKSPPTGGDAEHDERTGGTDERSRNGWRWTSR